MRNFSMQTQKANVFNYHAYFTYLSKQGESKEARHLFFS